MRWPAPTMQPRYHPDARLFRRTGPAVRRTGRRRDSIAANRCTGSSGKCAGTATLRHASITCATRGVMRMPSHSRSSPVPMALRTSSMIERRASAACGQPRFDRGVALFEQRQQQMPDADIVVVVVSARLLCRAQDAFSCRIEASEQRDRPSAKQRRRCDAGTAAATLVGAAGFEPVTSASRTQRSTKLSYAPLHPAGPPAILGGAR